MIPTTRDREKKRDIGENVSFISGKNLSKRGIDG
jgi:hypothetical protein